MQEANCNRVDVSMLEERWSNTKYVNGNVESVVVYGKEEQWTLEEVIRYLCIDYIKDTMFQTRSAREEKVIALMNTQYFKSIPRVLQYSIINNTQGKLEESIPEKLMEIRGDKILLFLHMAQLCKVTEGFKEGIALCQENLLAFPQFSKTQRKYIIAALLKLNLKLTVMVTLSSVISEGKIIKYINAIDPTKFAKFYEMWFIVNRYEEAYKNQPDYIREEYLKIKDLLEVKLKKAFKLGANTKQSMDMSKEEHITKFDEIYSQVMHYELTPDRLTLVGREKVYVYAYRAGMQNVTLLDAIRAGNLQFIKCLIIAGVPITMEDLRLAIELNDLSCVRLLLSWGAIVNEDLILFASKVSSVKQIVDSLYYALHNYDDVKNLPSYKPVVKGEDAERIDIPKRISIEEAMKSGKPSNDEGKLYSFLSIQFKSAKEESESCYKDLRGMVRMYILRNAIMWDKELKQLASICQNSSELSSQAIMVLATRLAALKKELRVFFALDTTTASVLGKEVDKVLAQLPHLYHRYTSVMYLCDAVRWGDKKQVESILKSGNFLEEVPIAIAMAKTHSYKAIQGILKCYKPPLRGEKFRDMATSNTRDAKDHQRIEYVWDPNVVLHKHKDQIIINFPVLHSIILRFYEVRDGIGPGKAKEVRRSIVELLYLKCSSKLNGLGVIHFREAEVHKVPQTTPFVTMISNLVTLNLNANDYTMKDEFINAVCENIEHTIAYNECAEDVIDILSLRRVQVLCCFFRELPEAVLGCIWEANSKVLTDAIAEIFPDINAKLAKLSRGTVNNIVYPMIPFLYVPPYTSSASQVPFATVVPNNTTVANSLNNLYHYYDVGRSDQWHRG